MESFPPVITMERMIPALRNTQIGPLVRGLLDAIQQWAPTTNPDSVVVDGYRYDYDGSNLRIQIKQRKHFHLLEFVILNERRATARLSDLTTEIHGDFYLKPSNSTVSNLSGLRRESEGSFVQLEEFTILISLCDLNPPIRLTIEKYRITGVLGKTKIGNPVPVEHDPQVQSHFHNFKNNLLSENDMIDAVELGILSQASNHFGRREFPKDSNIKQEDSEETEDDESLNSQSFFSTQIPMADQIPVVRNSGPTLTPAASLQKLMQQVQEKQLVAKRAAISRPVLSTNTLISNQRLTPASEQTSDETVNAKKNMVPPPNAIETRVQVVINKAPERKNQNGKRDSPSENDVVQAARKRVRDQESIAHGNQTTALKEAQRTTPAAGFVAHKPSRQLRWRDMIIPKDQEKLLESDDALDPPKPGNPRPTCRLPDGLWQQFHKVMERRAGLGSKSPSEDAREQDEEQNSESEGDSESSDSDSTGSAVNAIVPKFTQPEAKNKKFPLGSRQAANDLDSVSEASEAITWDASPSQRPRRPEMPPDSSMEQPSPTRSNNHCHSSPSKLSQSQKNLVGPAQIGLVPATQTTIIDLESSDIDSDMELVVPQALDRIAEADQMEVESRRISSRSVRPIGRVSILVDSGYSVGPDGTRPAIVPSPQSHSRQTSVSLNTHDLVDQVINVESPSLDEDHDEYMDSRPPTSPRLEMSIHELEPHIRDQVADKPRVLKGLSSTARSDVTQSEDENHDMRMDLGRDSHEGEFVMARRGLRRKKSTALSIVTQDSEFNHRRYHEQVMASQKKATQKQYESNREDCPEDGDVESDHSISEPRPINDVFGSHENVSKRHKSDAASDNESSSIASDETDLDEALPGGRVSVAPSVDEDDTEEASAGEQESHPLSDEVEEMVHQQLQSDIATYSQRTITSPARSAVKSGASPSVRPGKHSEVQVPASSPVPAPTSPAKVLAYSQGNRKSNEVSEGDDVDSPTALSKRRKIDRDVSRTLERQKNHDSLDFERDGMQQRQGFKDGHDAGYHPPASRNDSEVHRPTAPRSEPGHESDLGDLSLLAEAAINHMGMGRLPEVQNQSLLDITHGRFADAYDDYDGDQKHFLGSCKLIQKLDSSGSHAPHQSLWDDFIIRNKVEYRRYLSECSDAVEFPMRYEIFYYERINEPLYTRRIITPKILAELVSVEGLATPSTPRSSRNDPSRQRPSLLKQYSSSTRRSSLANMISRRPSGAASPNHPSPLVRYLGIRSETPEASHAETRTEGKEPPEDSIIQNIDRSVDEWLQNSQASAHSVARIVDGGPRDPIPLERPLAVDTVRDPIISPPPRRDSTRRPLPLETITKPPSAHTSSVSVPSSTSGISAQRGHVNEPKVATQIEESIVLASTQGNLNLARRSLPWETSIKSSSAHSSSVFVPSTAPSICAQNKRTTESVVATQIEEPKVQFLRPSSINSKRRSLPWESNNKPPSFFTPSTSGLTPKRERTPEPQVATQIEEPNIKSPAPSIVNSKRRSLPWRTSPKVPSTQAPVAFASSVTPSTSIKRKRVTEPEVPAQIEQSKPVFPKPPSTPIQHAANGAKRQRTTEPAVGTQIVHPRITPPKPSSVNTEKEEQETPWYTHPNTTYNEFSSSYMSLKSERNRPQPTLLKVMSDRAKQKDKRLEVGGINIFHWMT